MMFSEAFADKDQKVVDAYLGHHELTMTNPVESQFVHAIDPEVLKEGKARIFLIRNQTGRIDCAGHVVAHGGVLEWQGVTTHVDARGTGMATALACFARWTYACEDQFNFSCVVRILPNSGINKRALHAFTKAGFFDTGVTVNPPWDEHPACRHLKATLEPDGTYRARRLNADASTFSVVIQNSSKYGWR